MYAESDLPTSFEITPEVEQLRLIVRKLVREEIVLFEREIEETDAIPAEVAAITRRSGLHGLQIPREYGGMGLGMLDGCIITEEITWLSQSLLRFTGGDGMGIGLFGSEALKEKYLRGIAAGDLLTAFALTEPEAGSDAASIRSTAVRDGDRYILNGEKVMVTGGDTAHLILTFAVTDVAAGAGGITAFIIETGMPGFEVVRIEPKMGLRGIHTAHIAFHDMPVPAENVMGEENSGFVIAMKSLDLGRIRFNGAASIGNAQRLLEMSLHHARQRKQFGRQIGKFEAVGFMLARMAVEIHAARLMVYDAAVKVDRMRPVTLESAMVKLFATEVADRAADMAVQVHGGQGYMKDLEVERFYRDARLGRIWDGTSEIQQLIISRILLG